MKTIIKNRYTDLLYEHDDKELSSQNLQYIDFNGKTILSIPVSSSTVGRVRTGRCEHSVKTQIENQ